MKRKIRPSNSNPFYANEPAVARSKIADTTGFGSSGVGASTPKMVDKKPGRSSGVAPFASGHKPKAGHTTPVIKLGTKDTKGVPQQGKLRTSGHPQAHRLGGIKKIKGI